MEAEAILELVPRVDANFAAAISLILECPGRTVITGMGKSGIIGRKMAATFASTGTPSFYLHPAEGIHGDLGMVTAADVVIALSNSGETGEILNILPSLRRIGAKIIAMVGNANSTLAKNADVVLDVGVEKEACPLGLAPTSSTTAALAYGDAIALALLQKRNFTASQFAVFHPGGSLGRKLLLTVGNIMHKGNENPLVSADTTVQEALFVITDKGLGAVSVVDAEGKMLGVLTDGDIRRGLSKGVDFLQRSVADLMTKAPKYITADKLAAQALHLMESNQPKPITVLPVVDENMVVIGLLHMTDLVRQGVV
jgi:arabinose-5-phosphate isomerase